MKSYLPDFLLSDKKNELCTISTTRSEAELGDIVHVRRACSASSIIPMKRFSPGVILKRDVITNPVDPYTSSRVRAEEA